MNDGTKTRFLNVDLELRGTTELTELVQAFEPGAMTLCCMAFEDGYLANLERATQPTEAESAIRSFVSLIDKLPLARGSFGTARRGVTSRSAWTDQADVSDIERGASNPSLNKLNAIASAVGMEVELTKRRPAR